MKLTTAFFSEACLMAILQSTVALANQYPLQDGTKHDETRNKDPFTDEFSELANATLDKWHVAGLAISVVDGDEVYAKGYGLATLPDVPATPETLWYVGSTTKAYTAAALGQLIDSNEHSALSEGWRSRVSDIIRDDFVLQNEWSTNHITLEDAASHRTGFTRHDQSILYNASRVKNVVRDTVRNMRNLPLHLEPRVEFHYCNLMFTVLTHVIETTTSKWLGDVLKEKIWAPLGMKSTYYDLQQAMDGPEHLSTGYYWHKEEKTLKPMPFVPTGPVNGAGAVISNVLDYSKWVRCLLRKGEPLSEAVHAAIREPRVVQNAKAGLGADVTLYSLGWFRTTMYGQVAYWHSGSVGTHGALVYWFPDLDYGVVIFSNYPSPVRQVLMWKLIGDKLGIPEEDRYDIGEKMRESEEVAEKDLQNATNILYPNRPSPPLPPTLKLSEFTGTYCDVGYGRLDIREENEQLNNKDLVLVAERKENDVVWEDQIRLHHVSGEFWTAYFIILSGPPVPSAFHQARFILGSDGKVTGLAITLFDREEMVSEGTIVFQKEA